MNFLKLIFFIFYRVIFCRGYELGILRMGKFRIGYFGLEFLNGTDCGEIISQIPVFGSFTDEEMHLLG